MHLDDYPQFSHLDVDHMVDHIRGLSHQLHQAWETGLSQTLPAMAPVKRVVIAGMGGSAIGADLIASFLLDRITVPLIVHRDYGLPAYAFGKETLVVVSSHSGNTEESLSAFEQACRSNCQVVAMTTGGKLFNEAQSMGVPVWVFIHNGQPRSGVGFSFGLLLALFVRLGLVADLSAEVMHTVDLMNDLITGLLPEVPIKENAAKRLAGQLVGRHVTVFGSGFMSSVARRWKCQFNEVAKAVASFEVMPEADHNTLAGICNPETAIEKEFALFLKSSCDHPRNLKRIDETRKIMMVEGLNTDTFEALGDSKMAHIWTSVLFGDMTAYYLAMAYDVDPTAIPSIWALKESMSEG